MKIRKSHHFGWRRQAERTLGITREKIITLEITSVDDEIWLLQDEVPMLFGEFLPLPAILFSARTASSFVLRLVRRGKKDSFLSEDFLSPFCEAGSQTFFFLTSCVFAVEVRSYFCE